MWDGVIAEPGLRHLSGVRGDCEEDVCFQQEVLGGAEEGPVDGGSGEVLAAEVGRNLRVDLLRGVQEAPPERFSRLVSTCCTESCLFRMMIIVAERNAFSDVEVAHRDECVLHGSIVPLDEGVPLFLDVVLAVGKRG